VSLFSFCEVNEVKLRNKNAYSLSEVWPKLTRAIQCCEQALQLLSGRFSKHSRILNLLQSFPGSGMHQRPPPQMVQYNHGSNERPPMFCYGPPPLISPPSDYRLMQCRAASGMEINLVEMFFIS